MKHAARQLGLSVDFKFLEAGLHEKPELLKKKLQEAIDDVSATDKADRIVIGYGVCGRGTVGIQARDIPLSIPKVHDCIAMFLGGSEAYRREFKKFPGTYYISAGWHEEKAVPVSQRKLHAWYERLRLHWPRLHFGEVSVERIDENWEFHVPVYLGDLSQEDVRVELYADVEEGLGAVCYAMAVCGEIAGAINGYIYRAEVSAQRPAGYYTPRIVPGHVAAAVPMEARFILWQQ
jgi:hypothetical protein